MLFHEKLDLKLLRLVRANPVLYDYNNPQYVDINTREVIWQKIGDELKRPSAACKVRWINIRDVYRRILKKNSEPGQVPKVYKYDNEVSFLRPYFREITSSINDNFDDADDRTSATMEGFENDEHNIKSDIEEEPQPKNKVKWSSKSNIKKKKKKQRYAENEDPISTSVFNESSTPSQEFDCSDPVDAFLLSIGATLKTFSPYHLNLAKSKIFAVVQEHDLQQIVQKEQTNESISSDIKIVTSETMYMQ